MRMITVTYVETPAAGGKTDMLCNLFVTSDDESGTANGVTAVEAAADFFAETVAEIGRASCRERVFVGV